MGTITFNSPYYPGENRIVIDDLRGDALMQRISDLIDGNATSYTIRRSINSTTDIGVLLSYSRYQSLIAATATGDAAPSCALEDRTDDFVIPNLNMLFDVIDGNAQQSPASIYRGSVEGSHVVRTSSSATITGSLSLDVGEPIYQPTLGLTGSIIAVSSRAATGRLTMVDMGATAGSTSGIKNNDHFTLSDGTTSKVFEYVITGSATGGHVGITAAYGTTAGIVRTRTINAIQGQSFGITASAGSGLVILLNNETAGVAGNVAIVEKMDYATLTSRGMSGGIDAGTVIIPTGVSGAGGIVTFAAGVVGSLVTVSYSKNLYKAIAIRRAASPFSMTGGIGSTGAAVNREAVLMSASQYNALIAVQP